MAEPAAVAQVVVDRPVAGLDRPLSYRIPVGMAVGPGHAVQVPLGRGRAVGIVTAVGEELADTPAALRPLLGLVDPEPVLSPALVALAQWIARRYACYLPQALAAMVPAAVRQGRRLPPGPRHLAAQAAPPRGARRLAAYRYAVAHPGCAEGELRRATGLDRAGLDALLAGGFLREVVPDPSPGWPPPAPPPLNAAQQEALEQIRRHRVTLLEGVTGSGKTEVYLALMREVLAAGGSALLLVPEIALTPQTVERIRRQLGPAVGVWHSRLTDRERLATWARARQGALRVVVGARSAVFLPLPRLAAIVVDEEHEGTYKQDDHPRYHTREVAEERARLEGARLVLGSATPSLESAYRARSGQIGWARLPNRFGAAVLPRVAVVDMREELRRGNRSMFSLTLRRALEARLRLGQQSLLFLNRRGYASFVLCRDCGQAVRCRHCSVTLTYHRQPESLVCHYCQARQAVPTGCPACGSRRIRHFGVGTQQVAEEVQRLWPTARVLRADRDAVAEDGREAYERLYRAFRDGAADVLVGTQMVAKGMDWPRVTLVGIVAADVALHLPDFRAAERTFQLLVQAAGRAGRRSEAGEVVIQTYSPRHYAVAAAAQQDFQAFYEAELAFRRELGYPPFGSLWLVEIRGEDGEAVRQEAERAAAAVEQAWPEVERLGPVPAPIARLRGQHRLHLLLRDRGGGRSGPPPLPPPAAGVTLTVTVDPYHMM